MEDGWGGNRENISTNQEVFKKVKNKPNYSTYENIMLPEVVVTAVPYYDYYSYYIYLGGGGSYYNASEFDNSGYSNYIGGSRGGGLVFVNFNFTKINDSKIYNSCIKSVLNDLRNNNFYGKVGDIIRKLNGNSSPVYYFEEVRIPNTIKSDGSVSRLLGQIVNGNTVQLNLTNLETASKQMIAKTIVHEMLHLYLNNSEESLDHSKMSTEYVNPMADLIVSLGGITKEEAVLLCWSGLKSTNAFKLLTESQKNNAESVYKLYLNLKNDKLNGTYCNN